MIAPMENRVQMVCSMFQPITGQPLDIGKYENRLMLQKIVYLAQSAGLGFGYNFSWYLRGPYCSELTKDYFDLVDAKPTIRPGSFIGREKSIIDALKGNFSKEVASDTGLELLGSLVFVIRDMHVSQKAAAIEKLRSLKPWFTAEEIKEVYEKMEKSKLFN